MAMLCNFGETELPRTTQEVRDRDLSCVETIFDFDYELSLYETQIADSVYYNPILSQKVSNLCVQYNVNQLALSSKDYDWKVESLRLACHGAIAEGDVQLLQEYASDMKVIALQRAVVREALSRLRQEKGG